MILVRALVTALAAGTLVAAPVLTPVSAAPHPVTGRIQRVDVALAAAATAAGMVESEPVQVESFSLVGVTWDPASGVAPDALRVEVRTDAGDGWGPWTLLPGLDEGPDAGTAEAARAVTTATSPLWVGEASVVQTRVGPAPAPAAAPAPAPEAEAARAALPSSLELNLVDPGTSAADSNVRVLPMATADAVAARPTFVNRAQWGADENKKNCQSEYNDTVEAAVVHHTAGSNSYSTQAEAMRQLRADYAYHTDVLGWCDLGYNVVVDKFGNVYEGRSGGLDEAVVGAHAGGFNSDTFGVSALGNYSTTAAPAAMVNAITRVVAWKLNLYERDAQGTVVLTSAGGGTSRYPAGQEVRVNVVSGHRDVGLTDCPGSSLYGRLAAIRSGAAALMGPLPPISTNLLRTATDPRVWVVSATQKFPVTDLRAFAALTRLGTVGVVPSSELTRRVSGPAFGRFAVAPTGEVWYLDGGTSAYVSSCDRVYAFGQTCSALPTLTGPQVAKFLPAPPLQGFVKGRETDGVYVMWGGARRPVTSWADLVAVSGGAVPPISVLEQATVDAMPLGARMLPPGTMVKSAADARVVVVDGNHRSVPLESFSVATAHGLDGLQVVAAADLAQYPGWTGFMVPTVRCPAGAFVGVAGTLRPLDAATAGAVGNRVWIPLAAETCAALGASTGSPAFSGPLFAKGDSTPNIYLLTGDQKRPITSYQRFQQLGGSAYPAFVPFSDTALAALPTGPDA